ncbi:putative Ig domain-containing protein [Sphingomonas ginsenosidivorax]|nr:putative Ig domain-containing protein [Sphingomonas ginsenosidivorax]
MTPRRCAGDGIVGVVRRIVVTLVLAWLLLAGATIAQAQTHYSVVYGTGGAGSGQLSTLRVNATGGDQIIFQAGDLQTAAGISGATARGRFIKGDGTIVRLGTGYSVRFTATGNVLSYSSSGGNFSITPSASSPATQLLGGQVEIVTIGSAPTTPITVGEIGTFDIYGGGPASYLAPSVLYDATVTITSPTSVTGVAPVSGPAAGGASVVITGTGLTGATAVSFGGTAAATFTVDSATQITATTPAKPAGPVTVAVSAPGGTGSLANAYTYVAAPTVSAVAPGTGPSAGGQSVVITGNGFVAGSTVLFGATAAVAVTIDSATQITAVSPPGTGTVGISVTTTGGTGVLAGAYGYASPPTVTAATPTTGPTAGGTTVVITGTNFAGTSAVTFGATAATAVTIDSATQITATTPAGIAGPVAIGVTTPGGTATLGGVFTYAAAPTLSSVAPPSGPIAGGTGIVITGTNFTGATAVTVGGVAATGFIVDSATQISATAPAAPGYAAGTVAVAVVTAGGTATLANGFTYVAAPTAASRSVSTGYNQSATIDLSASISGSYTVVTLGAGPVHGTLTPGAPGNYQTAVYQPTAGYAGPDSYSYTATGPGGTSAAATVSITVGTPTIAIAPSTLPAGQAGTAYSQTLTASGGATPYAFAATGLPTGLALAADGTLSGTPTQAGSFSVDVTAQDSSTGVGPFSGTRNYTLSVAAPTIVVAPVTLPAATVGVAYGETVTASGGSGPYSFAITSGDLPGLALSGAGALSGTPTAGGSFGITITATDAGGFTGVRDYTLTVAAPTVTLTPETLPAGQAGTAYGATITATGGTAPYTYAVIAGALPSGLTLSASGTLAGTPEASGSFSFGVTATDSSGGSGPYAGTRSYTLAIAAPALTLAPATLGNATVGVAYNAGITASGGTAPYAYAVTAGALPAGVTLAADGTLSGTTTAGGTYAFTVTATDATAVGSGGPYSVSRVYTLVVAAPTVVLAPARLPAGQAGVAYSQTFLAIGGTAPYTFAVTAGALPSGLSLSASGTLAGTPSAGGSFPFSVTATDSSGGSGPYAGTRSYTLGIGGPTLALTPTSLASATVGVTYSASIAASGGTAPYAYAVTAGALPAGLVLAADGTLSGTPTAGGSFGVTITATDAGGFAGAGGYTLVVAAPAVSLEPASLPAGQTGTAYSQVLLATGSTASYSYAVSAGTLPAGLSLSASGTLAGTPSANGSFAFSVTATDSSSGSGPYAGTRSYTLTIGAPTLTLVPATLANATAGVAYSASLTASGGTAPYAYTVTAGALPAGLALAADGTLMGTATAAAAGTYGFTVTATDATAAGSGGPYSASRAYTLVVAAPTVILAPASLPAGRVGTAYSQTLIAVGGAAPNAFAVTAGALPSGVSLSASGTLAGTPSASGSFTFTVTATDSSSGNGPYAGTRSYTLAIGAATTTLTPAPATLTGATVGATYVASIAASGGTAPYAYAVTAGALPAWLALAADGTLSGTPLAGGSFTFGVTVTDSSGGSGPYAATQDYTVRVKAAVQPIAVDTTLTAKYGAGPTPVPLQLSGPPAVGVAVSSPPAHGAAVAGGMSMTYAPAPGYAGTDRFTYTASNGGGTSAPATVTVTVTPPAVPTAADQSVTTAYGTATGIDLSGAIAGVHTGIAIASGPLHGTASVSGEVVRYAPTAGYYGADSFTYTATGPGGVSAAATVTITVGVQAIAIAPDSLAAGQQGMAYSATMSASGGAAPYRYASTGGALPAGLALSATGELAGTPTQSGSFAIAITATDSSTGAAPASAVRTYTLVIAAPPAPIAAGTSVTVTSPAGGTRSVDVTLSGLVSGVWTSIDLATPPLRGTVTLATTPAGGAGGQPIVVATYTPPIGYRGHDGFTFVAFGPGGRSAPATIAITVLGSPPVAPTLTAGTGQNVPVTVDLTTQARGAPYTGAAIVSVNPSGAATAALIEGGVVDARTYQMRITPEPRYSGTIVVTYTLSNAVGTSAAATATVTVTARADPAADPLVRGLVGAQAEATRSFAATQLGNFARRNEALHGGGASSTARPFGVCFTNGFGLYGGYGGYPPSGIDRETALKMEHATEVAGAEAAYGAYGRPPTGLAGFGSDGYGGLDDRVGIGNRDGTGSGRSGRGAATPSRTEATAPGVLGAQGGYPRGSSAAAAAGGGDRRIGSIAIWSGGAITVGSRDATTRRVHLDVTSGGLSAGSDIKLADTLTVGIGGGYGSQRTRIGKGDARLDGDTWVGALYGSLAPLPGTFVDGVIGYGGVDFDSRRLAANGGIGVGHRDGTMRFGSLAGGLDRQGPGGMVSAYGRVEYLAATLDAYRETGAGLYDLAYGRRTLDSLSSVLGGRGAMYRPIDLGVVSPRLRFEWRHDYRGQGGQWLDYADLGGLARVVEGDRWPRDEFNLELGIGLQTETDWTFGVDLGGLLANGSRVGTLRGTIGRKF